MRYDSSYPYTPIPMEHEERPDERVLARVVSDAADRWRDTLRATPRLHVCFALGACGALAKDVGDHLFLPLSLLWLGVQISLRFKPSCCRTVGGVAVLLSLLAAGIAPGPGRLATPFFELTLCPNASAGASRTYGLRAPAASTASATCAQAAGAGSLVVSLDARQLDADRDYRPVFLLPTGARASLVLSIEDSLGRPLYIPTELELWSDDAFPLTSTPTAAAAHARAALPAIGVPAAAAATGGASARPVSSALASAAGGGFDASTRRNRRRLRGIRLGGLRGISRSTGFTRGTGSFFSPYRGVSQGPSRFSREPVSAYRRTGGAPAAVGRPGAAYHHNTPYVGVGYYPIAGYRPSVGYDIATGMTIGHMLRTPTHRPIQVLHTPRGEAAASLPTPTRRQGAYYWAAAAMHEGSMLRVARLVAAAAGTSEGNGTASASLPQSYDRYALADELRVVPSPAWPLRVTIGHFALVAARGAARAHPPPVYFGLQAASPPRLRTTVLAQSTSRSLRFVGCMLLICLMAVTLVGVSRRSAGSAWEDRVCVSRVDRVCFSADGELLSVGSRVQTQHTIERGGDGSWYAGTVLDVHPNGLHATLIYDDGEEEVTPLSEVYVLQARDEEEAASERPPLLASNVQTSTAATRRGTPSH